jgi:hypothetical protein
MLQHILRVSYIDLPITLQCLILHCYHIIRNITAVPIHCATRQVRGLLFISHIRLMEWSALRRRVIWLDEGDFEKYIIFINCLNINIIIYILTNNATSRQLRPHLFKRY